MPLFLSVPRGPKLYVEFARWSVPTGALRWAEMRRENREVLIWFGRLHIIYTPPRWLPGLSAGLGRAADAPAGCPG
ncbi:hypothetical protein GCM10011497_28090 [Elstera cyanobacteriorum]|nr:hypothetical protein GCM10011497_28090 [Elstera cyanobacteriorum]